MILLIPSQRVDVTAQQLANAKEVEPVAELSTTAGYGNMKLTHLAQNFRRLSCLSSEQAAAWGGTAFAHRLVSAMKNGDGLAALT